MEFTCALHVTMEAVVSYTAISPLPAQPAVYFCCTGPEITLAGRYPASCPMKPGLSSQRLLSAQPFTLLLVMIVFLNDFFKVVNSRFHSLDDGIAFLFINEFFPDGNLKSG